MAKRDPELTARNRVIKSMTDELKTMLPSVLKVTGFSDDKSLHGKIGGKNADYIDIRNAVIHSPEQFITLWLEGFKRTLLEIDEGARYGSNQYETYELLANHQVFKDYLYLFLRRTYIKNIDSLSRNRPSTEDSEIWIGQNNASYGLLVTPRFSNGVWVNDKSEIRHVPFKYWTIGHVLHTGLCIPNIDKKMTFNTITEYLDFFRYVLVRNSGSPHEIKLAEMYADYVLHHPNPMNIPLLIPEFRYNGITKLHKYRLDFTIIELESMNRIGYELSPWSSHGYIAKTAGLTQAQINETAKGNFEDEMRKHKDYFRKHDVFVLIYTDDDLNKIPTIFDDMVKYFEPKNIGSQMKFHIYNDFFKTSI
jgi:hypothetical protein